MSYADDLEALINALVEDRAKELAARKTGKPVPGGVGSSLGGTSLSTDGVIDQGAGSSGGGEDGNEDLKDKLKPGDEPEKFKLFDCETNEEVTLDGIGGGGAGPAYPTGFDEEKCKTGSFDCDVAPSEMMIKYQAGDDPYAPNPTWGPWYIDETGWKDACVAAGHEMRASGVNEYCYYKKGTQYENIPVPSVKVTYSGLTQSEQDEYCERQGQWPAPDKNHLVWNEEKGCMEPLCPELNNQVADKYKACNDELILCDEDGNKVKVTIDGDEMKVTQAKHGQEATIKNGKVQSTKPLTPEQIARAFK